MRTLLLHPLLPLMLLAACSGDKATDEAIASYLTSLPDELKNVG